MYLQTIAKALERFTEGRSMASNSLALAEMISCAGCLGDKPGIKDELSGYLTEDSGETCPDADTHVLPRESLSDRSSSLPQGNAYSETKKGLVPLLAHIAKEGMPMQGT